MKSQWVIYGANGYTAQLAIKKAVAQGRAPVLAGRNGAAIEPLAKKTWSAVPNFRPDEPAAGDRRTAT